MARQLGGVERVANRQVDAERQALDGLQRRRAVRAPDLLGLVRPVAQRIHAHVVQAGHDEDAAVAPFAHAAGEPVHAHADFAASDVCHRRMGIEHIACDAEDPQHYERALCAGKG